MAWVAAPCVAGAWRDLQRTEPPRPTVTRAAGLGAGGTGAETVTPASTGEVAGGLVLAEDVPTEAAVASDAAPAVADAPAEAPADGPCADETAACREALRALRGDSLAGIDIDIRVGGNPGNDYPCECRLEGETFEQRRFATTTFTWKAAGYCHKPLYFEHWNLERYGHSHGFVADSFLSAAHFFGRLPTLPYQMGVELPWECVYPLGYYRPGSCAPWTVPAVPVSARGLAVGAATATGLVFLLP